MKLMFIIFLGKFIERNKEEPFVAYYPMIYIHNPFDPTPAVRIGTKESPVLLLNDLQIW